MDLSYIVCRGMWKRFSKSTKEKFAIEALGDVGYIVFKPGQLKDDKAWFVIYPFRNIKLIVDGKDTILMLPGDVLSLEFKKDFANQDIPTFELNVLRLLKSSS